MFKVKEDSFTFLLKYKMFLFKRDNWCVSCSNVLYGLIPLPYLSKFLFLFVCLFVWVEALHPSQQFFSHVGTEPPLPGYYQYFLGGKGILLKDTTRRPE